MSQHSVSDAAPSQEDQAISGGELLARAICAHSDAPIFGMGGFQLLPFYDAARRLGMQHYLVNDERAGIFAADSYAKVSRQVGLVDATLGPGATNLATGLVESLNSGTPIVAIIGDTHQQHSTKNMTQEGRQAEILRPACKELIHVSLPQRIPEAIERAFSVATRGRPGPVVVEVPEDVCHAQVHPTSTTRTARPHSDRVPGLRIVPSDDVLAQAAKLISEARRPVVLAGGGIHLSDAAGALDSFASSLNIPVAHTMSGLGSLPSSSAQNIGLFGRYSRIANDYIDSADLVIAVGCKLGEIATKRYVLPPATAKLIQVDISAEEIGRTSDVDLAIWGDARETLVALLKVLRANTPALGTTNSELVATLHDAKSAWSSSAKAKSTSAEMPISMPRLIHDLCECAPSDRIVVADGGFAAHWSALLLDPYEAGRNFIADRGFASIGYGLPGAIGASFAAPSTHVIALTGDAGFNMMVGELETARRLGVRATIVVVNNAASGYVKALQHIMYGPDAYHASDLNELNFALIAKAFGCRGIRVEEPEMLTAAFVEAFESDVLTVIDVVVTRDPGAMLPALDSRAVQPAPGDRIA